MSNRYGKSADLIADTTVSNAILRGTGDNYGKLAQSYQPTASKSLTVLRWRGAKSNSPVGTIWISIYEAGANPEAGTLLGVTYPLDVSTLATGYNYFTFQTPVPVISGQQYYFVLEGDYSYSSANYALWYRSTSSVYANGSAWTYSVGTWTQQSTWDFNLLTFDNTDGGAFDLDSNGSGANGAVTLADLTSYKAGVAPALTDSLYIYNNALFVLCDMEVLSIKVVSRGEISTGAAIAGQKVGRSKYEAGSKIIYLGDATNTNSGEKSQPTSAGSESLNCEYVILGTPSKPVIQTNSVDGINTNYKFTNYLGYGKVLIKYLQCNNTYSTPFNTLPVSATRTNIPLVINNSIFSGLTGTVGIFSCVVNIDLDCDFRCNTANVNSGTSAFYWLQPIAGLGLNSGGRVRLQGCYLNPDSNYNYSYYFSGQVRAGYQNFELAYADIRPTTITPADLTLTNPAKDGELRFTIGNIASYASTDEINIFNNTGDTLLACIPKSRYVANGNYGIIAGLTNDQQYTLYAKATSDNNTYSDKSATATGTPTKIPSTPRKFDLLRQPCSKGVLV